MIKREDLKIGDTTIVDGLKVKMYKKELLTLSGRDYYALIGKTKRGKLWSTGYICIKAD
jgi:hypothetical protein